VLAVTLVSLATTARAGADITRVRPPMTVDGLLSADGAGGLYPWQLSLAGYLTYSRNPLVWYYEAEDVYEPIVGHQLTLDLVAAMGLWERIDVSMALPIVLLQRGPNDALLAGEVLAGAGIGDLRLTPRVALMRERTSGFGLSIIPELTVPTGSSRRLMGDPSVAFRPRVAATVPLAVFPIRFVGSLGYNWRRNELVGDPLDGEVLELQDEWLFHVGGAVDFADIIGVPVAALVELAGATAATDPFAANGLSALEVLVGARSRWLDDWVVTAAVAGGLTRGVGTAAYRFILGTAWAPLRVDRDGDGIPDYSDDCPEQPEDFDEYQDTDGCPDLDNDEDGVPDDLDRCPDEKEDHNGLADEDGCPDASELDRDNDGINDPDDKCPDKPEDKDGFEDDDGCPDLDHDQDGVFDVNDECPDEKETINGIDDEDGCPDEGEGATTFIESERIEIRESVHFESGKSTIKDESTSLLDQVALQILAHPEIHKIRIEGHTDSMGTEEDNLYLSQDRADAVRRYLIGKQVPEEKLEAKGYGETMPIASNETKRGRAMNRRVEFVIVQSD
jgi:outer membrane protein OmpA-like peptidoglycan-associated protein